MRRIRRPPRPLKRVGYWRSPAEPALPDPHEYVDASWDAVERERVIFYLDNGYYLYGWCGFSWCRFGCPNDAEMGSSDLTDGTWLFPEGLVHYVRRHALKPPEDFLQHMRESGFLVPDLPEDEVGLVVE